MPMVLILMDQLLQDLQSVRDISSTAMGDVCGPEFLIFGRVVRYSVGQTSAPVPCAHHNVTDLNTVSM